MIDKIDIASMKVEDVVKTLESIATEGGIRYRRLAALQTAERRYQSCAEKLRGYVSLVDASTCLFAETCDEVSREHADSAELSGFDYRLLLARNTNSFNAIRASQISAHSGYPFQAFTLLRNVFDNLVCTSAVMCGIATFVEVEGIPDGKWDDFKLVKRRRIKAEYRIRQSILGPNSGLSQVAVEQLRKLDEMFDLETHGARLSMAQTGEWIRGNSDLQVSPLFEEMQFAMYINRHCEIGWMLHRLLPLMQLSRFSDSWKEKWRIIDHAYRRTVEALTTQLKKPIGSALVEFVFAKFPFDQDSTFPIG